MGAGKCIRLMKKGQPLREKKYHGKTADGTIWDRGLLFLGDSDSDLMPKGEYSNAKTGTFAFCW
jgi:hypothetical protein